MMYWLDSLQEGPGERAARGKNLSSFNRARNLLGNNGSENISVFILSHSQ